MDSVDARAFGRLEGEVQALREAFEQQNESLKELAENLATIQATLAEARGGWRVMLALAGGSAAVAGSITWALQHIKFQ